MQLNRAPNGGETFIVPLGWTVEIRLKNHDAAPHSARVVAAIDPVPPTLPAAVAPDAETANAQSEAVRGQCVSPDLDSRLSR